MERSVRLEMKPNASLEMKGPSVRLEMKEPQGRAVVSLTVAGCSLSQTAGVRMYAHTSTTEHDQVIGGGGFTTEMSKCQIVHN
jgi:hypothetical protein